MKKMSTKNGVLKLIAVLAVLGLVAAACGDDDDDETAASEGATETSASGEGEGGEVSGEPIKIGVPMNLSGPASALGLQTVDGVKAWAEWANEHGGLLGRPVELVIRDCESSPQRCAEVSELLIENEDVIGLLGPDGTPTTLSVVPVVNRLETPMVALSGGWPMGLSQEEQYWTFLAFPRLVEMFGTYKSDLWDPNGWTDIAVLGASSPLLSSVEEWFPTAPEPINYLGLTEFPPGSTDITAQVLEVADKDPDYVLTFNSGSDAITALSAFTRLGLDIPRGNQGLTYDLNAISDEDLEGAYGATYPSFVVYNEIVDESYVTWDYIQEYQEAMEAGGYEFYDGTTNAILGWDTAVSFAAAVEEVGSTDRAAIRDALETQEIQLHNGLYKRSPEEHEGVEGGYVIIQFRDGEWTMVSDPEG